MSAPDLAAELREADRLLRLIRDDHFIDPEIAAWRARNAAVLGPAEPLAKPPFQPGTWVVYHKAVANGGRATRVDAVKFDTLVHAWVWRKARTPDVAAFWRRCADYRARARDIAEPEEAKPAEPDVLPRGARVKIKKFGAEGVYHFGGSVVTVAGTIRPDNELNYYMVEGVGSWPRSSLEVVELPPKTETKETA